jgi:hypothetical protein
MAVFYPPLAARGSHIWSGPLVGHCGWDFVRSGVAFARGKDLHIRSVLHPPNPHSRSSPVSPNPLCPIPSNPRRGSCLPLPHPSPSSSNLSPPTTFSGRPRTVPHQESSGWWPAGEVHCRACHAVSERAGGGQREQRRRCRTSRWWPAGAASPPRAMPSLGGAVLSPGRDFICVRFVCSSILFRPRFEIL